jgi:hypothetical protein
MDPLIILMRELFELIAPLVEWLEELEMLITLRDLFAIYDI